VTRKSIATNMAVVSCDVCGRTLLRGENADIFLVGGSRRTVCELCTSRAVHEGWIREGLDDVSSSRTPERGRSFLQRLRHRRERPEREPVAERVPRAERRARPAPPADDAYADADDPAGYAEAAAPDPAVAWAPPAAAAAAPPAAPRPPPMRRTTRHPRRRPRTPPPTTRPTPSGASRGPCTRSPRTPS
jgi:hypothetical protein